MIEHRDLLGGTIELGSYVAYPQGNGLHIGIVVKLNPKMVKVKRVNSYSWTANKYPEDLVLVDGARATMYAIKHSSN